jgi:glycosyltransferase involved in cell wall biosynthesis
MNQACEAVVRHFGPDVIHVHGTENPFGLIGSRSQAPVIISLQGLLTVYERFFFHGMTCHEVARLALKRSFALGRSEIHGYWRCVNMAVREREIMRINKSFMGRTEWDKAVLRAVNPAATYYHCDEVLRPPFYGSEWQLKTAAPRTIFCTSNTLTWKGAECLIEALGLLHGAGYADVGLRIAGIPPKGPGSEFYTARARKHGVMNSIEWLGRLDAEELVRELLGATLFAYPSHIDNSPNALCEALLVGVPTVASYVGGVPSLIEDGRDGLLYPDGDPYALAGRIRHLLDNASFAVETGKKARERAIHRHDPDSIVNSLVDIYRALLSRRVAPTSITEP